MIINDNSTEQINIALLDLEKKISALKDDRSIIDSLKDSVSIIRASLNETKAGLESGATYNISITGNATTATTATTAITAESAERASKDDNGDTITTTYQKKADMTDYQKVSEKSAVAGYVKCNQTANGSYILVATVNGGNVSYSWVARA